MLNEWFINIEGNLKLEQSWKPLHNFLQGKLKWASILAAKKNVNLSITDSTSASEFGVSGDGDLVNTHSIEAAGEEEESSSSGLFS